MYSGLLYRMLGGMSIKFHLDIYFMFFCFKVYKIIDNFLMDNEFYKLKSIMTNNLFPWYTNCDYGVSQKDSDDGMYLTHNFYSDYCFRSDFSDLLEPLITKICPKSIVRIKGNLYPGSTNFIYHDYHTDYDFQHYGFIFYINTNDGKTILENNVEINSIENRILFFNPHLPHRSTNCTDKKYRMNINCNYF